MASLNSRPLRRLATLAATLLAGAVLTGCGAPRVHEVYRLSSLDALPDAVQAASDERLSAGEAELRRLVISAHQLQPARVRQHEMSLASTAPALPLGSSSLHGCVPEYIAEFTVRSSNLIAAESRGVPMVVASAPLRRF